MKYFSDGGDYIVVLAKGEELKTSLTEFVKKTNTATAWLNAIGAALEVELAYYHLDKKEYVYKTFTGPLEITSLSGNISTKNAKPLFHIHGTFASENYGAIGGHIRKLVVAATCEVYVQKNSMNLTRRKDSGIGLDLLEQG